jgi:2-succinyl-5-enolpyruvyl-6-hydroxy-3-cyclohexene-1-carboxylate synthase
MCPGSRSTPLALTFERHPGIKTWMHLDERSCAYFALGMAKASGEPIAILCSSGTAAVNFAPAVVEAFHSHVPLIVLTADRPPELQGLGANQTIDQQNLYGSAARWFVEMPLQEASDHMLRYVSMVAHRSVRIARGDPPGPVHLNFPFREPLVPIGHHQPRVENEEPRQTASLEKSGTIDNPGEPAPIEIALHDSIEAAFLKAERPLIICGPSAYADLGAVQRLAKSGVPILAESLSDVRTCGPYYGAHILGSYDNFLRESGLSKSLRPDLILRFGAPPTSRVIERYLRLHRDVMQVVVPTFAEWPDPDLTGHKVEVRGPDAVWDALSRCVSQRSGDWLNAWQQAERNSLEAIHSVTEKEADCSEPTAVLDLAEVIPPVYPVFAGNSMPVRDLESFWPAGKQLQLFYGSRGASGIDGVVSTAMGMAARGHGVVLVIGDLSFYHDMNGLLAAKRFGLRATIVLINNDGGGIFSFLPQHDDAEHFEALWGTPHGLDFSHVAGLYGVGFQRVTTREEYRAALKASFWADGVQVIEIKTDREENLRLHQRIWDAVAEAVKDVALP